MRNNYWSRRDLIERQRLFNLTENQLVKLLKKKYIKVAKDVQLRLQDIVIKIQSTNQPTANQLYIQDRLFKLYNELQNELIALGEFENKAMTGTFEDYYQNVFRQSTVAKNPVDELLIEPDKVQRAITSVWTGDAKNFSDRIWIHKRQLMAKLNDGLTNIIATGKNWAILSKEIANDFNVAFNDSKRLVRTELTHIEAMATLDRYKSEGIEEVIYVAEIDACKICLPMNGKVYGINDVAMIPQHPNCRCTYLAVIPELSQRLPDLMQRVMERRKNKFEQESQI